jgi:hypothetical protein
MRHDVVSADELVPHRPGFDSAAFENGHGYFIQQGHRLAR